MKEELEEVRQADRKAAEEASEASNREEFSRQLAAMEAEVMSKDKQVRGAFVCGLEFD